MIPFDDFQTRLSQLNSDARQYLAAEQYAAFQAIPQADRERQLKMICEQPLTEFSPVYTAVSRARWAETLQLLRLPSNFTLLEVASGAADMIPQAMARAYPNSRYISANMNERLNAGLLRNTKDLALPIELIPEDARLIDRRLPPDSVDVIAFQHGVNDVLQAILCEQQGIDTVHSDWMQTLPAMIDLLKAELAADTLEAHARPAFLGLMRALLTVLKPGGIVICHHYLFQVDLDLGYPRSLTEAMIPLVRPWFEELPGCAERFFEGYASQWWLFLQKGCFS